MWYIWPTTAGETGSFTDAQRYIQSDGVRHQQMITLLSHYIWNVRWHDNEHIVITFLLFINHTAASYRINIKPIFQRKVVTEIFLFSWSRISFFFFAFNKWVVIKKYQFTECYQSFHLNLFKKANNPFLQTISKTELFNEITFSLSIFYLNSFLKTFHYIIIHLELVQKPLLGRLIYTT